MGFLKQEVPVIDFETWSRGTRAEKIKPMAKHWAEVGFGTPVAGVPCCSVVCGTLSTRPRMTRAAIQ